MSPEPRARRTRRVPLALLLLAAGLTSAGPGGASPAGGDVPACDQRPPSFRPPAQLGQGFGFEPGIEVDSKGTIFVMAHKLSLAAEVDGTKARTSSWLWRSVDGGGTFLDMEGENGITNLAFAFEGDGAVDANDRFYYVDTYFVDNFFSRYSNRGATLETWKHAVPATVESDDRPWITAHGDGIVYYAANATGSLYRSMDRGETFQKLTIPFGAGFPDADPNSSYVYLGLRTPNSSHVFAAISPDRGATWRSVTIAPYAVGPKSTNPVLAVSPADGSVYMTWNDGYEKLWLARSTDRGSTWSLHDITPFAGRFEFPWVSVSPTGDVGVLFEADPAAIPGSEGFVYGMIWRPASDCLRDAADPASVCAGPASAFGRLQPAPVGTFPSQQDFIQNEFTPDGAFVAPFEDANQRIRFTKQTGGPNLDGTRFCGVVGTP